MTARARDREPQVGGDEPRRPEHSLPSYDEPTPETHRRLTREEEAELALMRTTFSPGARSVLIALFLVTMTLVSAIQFIHELRGGRPTVAAELAKLLPTDRRQLLPRAATIKATEKAIEEGSVVSQWLLPRVQSFLTGKLGAGNEQAYVGRDGWLFYRPDIEYVTGAPFLQPARLRHRAAAGVQPDPVRAIVDFRDQLAARGIELIVMPVPVKPTVDGEQLAGSVASDSLQNPSFAEWKAHLEREHVRVFDPAPLLIERKKTARGAPQYLATDSHWRPEAMEAVADQLAGIIPGGATKGEPTKESPMEIAGLGDIAAMLKLPPAPTTFSRERVTIHQVITRTGIWRPAKDAEVLLLGDSFSNIFSLGAMGWGESAGFAEHLSRALGDRPLDYILRNSDGAFATREILQRDLARGRDRLAGKRWVIWEFAARELSMGDWKLLPMKLEAAKPARFFTPRSGEEIVVTGTAESVSPVPRAGSVPYKDHILSLHLVDITGVPSVDTEAAEALIYLWSMRDNVWTAAAAIRAGDRVTVRLKSWADVSAQYEKFNRSEIDDPAVQLEEPAWGEILR